MQKAAKMKSLDKISVRLGIFILCISLVLSSLTVVSYAEDDIIVTIDGERIIFDVPPIIVGAGYTMVPMRAIFESMGYTVEYDPNGGTNEGIPVASIKAVNAEKDRIIIMYIGSLTMYRCAYSEYLRLGDTALQTGNIRQLQTAPEIYDGRTLVPLRAVAEATDAAVSWDGSTRTVTIVRSPGNPTYEGFDIPDYGYINGCEPLFVFVSSDDNNAVYNYKYDKDALNRYKAALEKAGFQEGISSSEDLVSGYFRGSEWVLISSLEFTDRILVAPHHSGVQSTTPNYEGFDNVPDYGYHTGNYLMYQQADEDGNMVYMYDYTEQSLAQYISVLKNSGFIAAPSGDDHVVYRRGATYVFMSLSPEDGVILITPIVIEVQGPQDRMYGGFNVPNYGYHTGCVLLAQQPDQQGDMAYVYSSTLDDARKYISLLESLGFMIAGSNENYLVYGKRTEFVIIGMFPDDGIVVITPYKQ